MTRGLWLAFVFAVVSLGFSQDCAAQEERIRIWSASNVTQVEDITEASTGFHKSVMKAARSALRKGDIKARDMIRLRIAMLSPSFRERVQDLAVIQLSASGLAGDENVPVNDEGRVLRASIDWDAILDFIERLIPLILQLIDIFSGVDS